MACDEATILKRERKNKGKDMIYHKKYGNLPNSLHQRD